MKNYKLLFKLLQQPNDQGITLTELLVALVISGIVLTATTSGFINVLRANRDVESKGTQLSNLTRALTFIQEDIKPGVSVTVSEISDSQCTDVDSRCLIIESDNGNQIYYGFKDISGDTSTFLKPGILKRQEYDGSGNALDYKGDTLPSSEIEEQQTAWQEEFTTVADGLEINAQDPVCDDGGTITWGNGTTPTLYGDTGNGFRFCIDETRNRLARIFLYGHIIDSNTILNVDSFSFARSNQPASP
ncbi:prepilin-type N-terminal cleavage/methylation domain-containing protein [Cyanobacterium stanieri LEGE 03274]|uniref:Prepilin-type N-terminal cleavage/methylation domain-containing protein n=1 Tax=Cyanobacterium stanieri LEGE 03274 TaxID=1828756 RepID=A0ABR9V3N0_9CHRO|nr:prepilin-type N-terminal cleavage/methylation domain-containing protein [Cyanobacterium stanieri]MBE9221419.1 prepilin-type N-terminal cleavage/methylation domain-containing protein [Cyanobacterium stanieri LEGE 03274]